MDLACICGGIDILLIIVIGALFRFVKRKKCNCPCHEEEEKNENNVKG